MSEALKLSLRSGETVLWSGRPQQGILLRAEDALLVPFGLLWASFAVYWQMTAIAGVQAGRAPFVVLIWGLVLVLIGFHLVFGRFIVDAYRRSRVFYAVTNQRVLIASGPGSRTVHSIVSQRITSLTITERTRDIGTIRFGSPPLLGRGWRCLGFDPVPMLERIRDARRVYSLICEMHQSTP